MVTSGSASSRSASCVPSLDSSDQDGMQRSGPTISRTRSARAGHSLARFAEDRTRMRHGIPIDSMSMLCEVLEREISECVHG